MGALSKFVLGAAGGGVMAFGEEVRNQAAQRREQALLNMRAKIEADQYKVQRQDNIADMETERAYKENDIAREMDFRGDLALVETQGKFNQSIMDAQADERIARIKGEEDRKTQASNPKNRYQDVTNADGSKTLVDISGPEPRRLNAGKNVWEEGRQVTDEELSQITQQVDEELKAPGMFSGQEARAKYQLTRDRLIAQKTSSLLGKSQGREYLPAGPRMLDAAMGEGKANEATAPSAGRAAATQPVAAPSQPPAMSFGGREVKTDAQLYGESEAQKAINARREIEVQQGNAPGAAFASTAPARESMAQKAGASKIPVEQRGVEYNKLAKVYSDAVRSLSSGRAPDAASLQQAIRFASMTNNAKVKAELEKILSQVQ